MAKLFPFLRSSRPADNGDSDDDAIPRYAFYASTTLLVVLAIFYAGYHSGAKRDSLVHRAITSLRSSFKDVKETSVVHPAHLLQPARYAGSGVTIDTVKDDGALVLLSGFFGDHHEIRLLRRDGSLVARWPLAFARYFPHPTHLKAPPATDFNVDTHGSLALPDGSVIFNYDYMGLVKLDRCGRLVWTVPRQTHHSVERAEGGGFWVPSQRVIQDPKQATEQFPPFHAPLVDSTIMKISEDGKIVDEFSVPKIFYDHGLEVLLTAAADIYIERPAGAWNREIIHLNKVTELSSALAPDFPLFRAGDLMISVRRLDLLMVFDGKTHAPKWWKIGPWKCQHDPEFVPGGKIIVFNNNIHEEIVFGGDPDAMRTTPGTPLSTPRVSNITEVDPATNQTRIIYGGRDDQALLTVTRGKVDRTPAGGLLITEHDGGRAFETDANGRIVWQFVNRYSANEVGEVGEARLYPRGYFTVEDWSCPK